MRKIFLAAAVLSMMLVSIEAQAEGFLIKGGLTFQTFSGATDAIENLDFKGFTKWEAGLGYQSPTFGGFCIQPELLYKAKGVKATYSDPEVSTTESTAEVHMSFLELPVNIQWGLELFVFRPFIFASPYVGINLGNKIVGEGSVTESLKSVIKTMEYGLGLGVGVDISKFQITAKYNWDFGGLASWKDYWEQVKDIKVSEGMVEIGLAIIF